MKKIKFNLSFSLHNRKVSDEFIKDPEGFSGSFNIEGSLSG